jgi:DNA-binding MarR family transcriptional regulator
MAEVKERPDVAVLSEIARIDQRVRIALERVLPEGLSAAQFAVLGRLAAADEPLSPSSLAADFAVTKPAMTNPLQRLQAQGLVAVAADALDRRRKWVAATAKGLQANRACLAAAGPARQALRQALPPDVFEAALPFLRDLRVFLEQST